MLHGRTLILVFLLGLSGLIYNSITAFEINDHNHKTHFSSIRDNTLNLEDTPYCVENPSNQSCVNFTLPNATMVLDKYCAMMPMPICTIKDICAAHSKDSKIGKSVYCTSFSILKGGCDTMYMGPCVDYKSMCHPNDTVSVVKECNTKSLYVPLQKQVEGYITSMCSDMQMEGCNDCNDDFSNCNVLEVYSSLCLMMPDMPQCKSWSMLCNDIPDWPICSQSSGDGKKVPIMRMYFHTGIIDYLLIKQWVPQNGWEYALTILAIIFLGILYEGLKTLRDWSEMKWKVRLRKLHSVQANTDFPINEIDIDNTYFLGYKQPFKWYIDLPRATFIFVQVGAAYLLMLIAMSYNVGYFFAVCGGAALGSLIFSRLLHPAYALNPANAMDYSSTSSEVCH